MTHSYLVEVIKTLSEGERSEIALELAHFLSDKGKNAENLAKLFDVICRAAPEFSADQLSKELVYGKVFPEKGVVKWKLEKIMAELNLFVRNWIVAKRFQGKNFEVQRQIEWALWLRERGLDERAMQVLEKTKADHWSEELESIEFYRNAFLIEDALHQWHSANNKLTEDLNIKSLLVKLELFLENYKVELQNRYLLQSKVANLPELEKAFAEEQVASEGSKLLQVSKSIYETLKSETPDVTAADKLLETIRSMEDGISTQTLDFLFSYLRNFYTILINNGNAGLLPVLHKTNLDNLERGFFYQNGKISQYAYLNICIVACRLTEFDWAKKFTEENKERVSHIDPNNTPYHYNMAYCLFSEQKFHEALSFIIDTPSNTLYHQKFRRLELQIYYETGSELLLYKLDSFRKFIERTGVKVMGKPVKEMNIEFVKALLQITQSPLKDKARSERLAKRIEEKKLIAEKTWLLQKARALG